MLTLTLLPASLRLFSEMIWDEGFKAWSLSLGKQKKFRKVTGERLVESK